MKKRRSEGAKRRMAVTLDAGPAVHQNAGLARYTERLAYHLHRDHVNTVDLTLFYNAHSGHSLPETLRPIPQHTISLGQYAWRLSVLASQILRRPFAERQLPAGEIYHAAEHLLPNLRRPTLLTVHDLIFERFPQHHTWTNRFFLKLGMPLFVRAASAIIAVSQQTRRDLIELYNVPPVKIHVIYEGIDQRFTPVDPPGVAAVRGKYGIERPYLLMVGTLEPRKNHATALRALARLKVDSFPHCLVIVGGRGWLFDPIQALVGELDLSADVIFTGRIPDDDLPALYSGADCFLMPSLYEGFGFPVLEAMACGTPVVCSNTSSLPEVAGDAALLVDPEDEGMLAAAMGRLLANSSLGSQLRCRGTEQAAGFRWSACVEQTVQIYAEVEGMDGD
ncbi:MAG: glycosyltransferase family 4 protein [Caldilineaceae bacterium]|nr:glycosyltransferase family 4 protein [Caldilineaceae bacterium]